MGEPIAIFKTCGRAAQKAHESKTKTVALACHAAVYISSAERGVSLTSPRAQHPHPHPHPHPQQAQQNVEALADAAVVRVEGGGGHLQAVGGVALSASELLEVKALLGG